MDGWSLTLLGGFGLHLADGTVADLPAQKDRALLAILAMASGDEQSREGLAGLLWSEHGDRQARDSLKQALVRLRRCLGGTGSSVLRTDRQSVALDKTALDIDVLAFQQLVRQGTLTSLGQAGRSIAAICSKASRSAIPRSKTGCWSSGSACGSCSSARSPA